MSAGSRDPGRPFHRVTAPLVRHAWNTRMVMVHRPACTDRFPAVRTGAAHRGRLSPPRLQPVPPMPPDTFLPAYRCLSRCRLFPMTALTGPDMAYAATRTRCLRPCRLARVRIPSLVPVLLQHVHCSFSNRSHPRGYPLKILRHPASGWRQERIAEQAPGP